ncbi:hypothetical protein KP509_07G019300 [Ceratopteris richardii]|uniref:Uncharacterized protein n=1 Tax=Ceratopteris richardii TaxID=49495 RepID=A0A8T2UF03_CERRI|nr:hypothetical protein KP509_07G019300 [Ceratopteris richardii]
MGNFMSSNWNYEGFYVKQAILCRSATIGWPDGQKWTAITADCIHLRSISGTCDCAKEIGCSTDFHRLSLNFAWRNTERNTVMDMVSIHVKRQVIIMRDFMSSKQCSFSYAH